jgi:uncharacterized protein (TIGR02391 family)
LIVSDLETESGMSDQLGFLKMIQGALQSIRNPNAHSIYTNISKIEAAQYLIFASILSKKIDQAKIQKT